jgi:cytochrome c553
MKVYRQILLAFLALTAVIAITLAARAADSGADLFKTNCAMCHGADGKGYSAIKTPDFTSAEEQAKLTDKQMFDIIKNGKPNTTMMGFNGRLSDDQISTLVKHIRSLGPKK